MSNGDLRAILIAQSQFPFSSMRAVSLLQKENFRAYTILNDIRVACTFELYIQMSSMPGLLGQLTQFALFLPLVNPADGKRKATDTNHGQIDKNQQLIKANFLKFVCRGYLSLKARFSTSALDTGKIRVFKAQVGVRGSQMGDLVGE